MTNPYDNLSEDEFFADDVRADIEDGVFDQIDEPDDALAVMRGRALIRAELATHRWNDDRWTLIVADDDALWTPTSASALAELFDPKENDR